MTSRKFDPPLCVVLEISCKLNGANVRFSFYTGYLFSFKTFLCEQMVVVASTIFSGILFARFCKVDYVSSVSFLFL